MGRSRRPVPKYLASKLLSIRESLDLTQDQMMERLLKEIDDKRVKIYQGHISGYERGEREPPLVVVMAYARIADLPMEWLVNDKRDLPL